jgi:hypothetical protein
LGKECRHGGVYSPSSHCQRYCSACLRWFHLGCLGSVEAEPTLHMILGYDYRQTADPHILRFLSIPVERGGLFGVVGNGRDQVQARKMACNDRVVAATWFRDIDAGYVEKCESMRLVYFQCPTCDRVI